MSNSDDIVANFFNNSKLNTAPLNNDLAKNLQTSKSPNQEINKSPKEEIFEALDQEINLPLNEYSFKLTKEDLLEGRFDSTNIEMNPQIVEAMEELIYRNKKAKSGLRKKKDIVNRALYEFLKRELKNMKTKSIKELQDEFKNLSKEELDKLAKKEDVYLTSSDEIFENNSYDVPRIIAIYWRPSLNGAEAKVLDYLVYKTWGFDHRFKDAGIDAIAFSQIVTGTKNNYDGKEIRYDYGAGVTKKSASQALILFEFLEIIEVIRSVDGKGANLTNKYRIKTADEWGRLSVSQKKIFMLEDPFVKVERARKYLQENGMLG